MRKRVLAVVALIALVGIVLFAVIVKERQRKEREQQLSSYYGVKPGMSKSEVGYTLGYPSSVQGPLRPDPSRNDWQISDEIKLKGGDVEGAKAPLPGGALQKYDDWNYNIGPDQIIVVFDAKSKKATSIYCRQMSNVARASKCQPILGLMVGSSEDDVRAALGVPDHQRITSVFKSMTYSRAGVELLLTKRRVYLVRKIVPTQR